MRFFEIVVSGAALISGVMAQLAINDYPSTGVQAGQTYTITYSPKDNVPTEFILRQGPSNNLNTIGPIGTATGGTFTWVVPSNLPSSGDYALEIRRGNTNNFSGQFGLTGGSGSFSSAVSSAASALSSAASALSSASSAAASITSRASSAASASPSASTGSNSTVSSATLSRSASASASRTASGSSGPPQATGAASALESSPMALVFGAVAAFFYLA